MAPLCSLHFSSLPFSPIPSPLHQGSSNKISTSISCSKSNAVDRQNSGGIGEECGVRRRELLFQAVSTAIVLPKVVLADENDDFRLYTDEVNKFTISIPQDWQVGSGEGDGVRALIGFYPPEASGSNVSIVITGLGADFTRLESFGKVDAFAESLIGGLDRSWQRPPGVAAKLIDSKSSNAFAIAPSSTRMVHSYA